MSRRGASRPVFFNLRRIQMPVGALTSITHRITGIVLALGIPLGFYIFHLSLASAQSYAHLLRITHTGLFKAALIVFVWALSHHLLAGVRHLLMDIGVGSHLAPARRSAWSVNVAGIALAALAGLAAWVVL